MFGIDAELQHALVAFNTFELRSWNGTESYCFSISFAGSFVGESFK